MLSRNLVLASVLLVFLVCSASPAPVEDKEPEENDFETEEAEEELSEEEEDDDDSRGQHMKGAGSQQATAAPKGSGLTSGSGLAIESPHGQKPNGGSQSGQVSSSTSTASGGAHGSNGRDGYYLPSDSSSQGGHDGFKPEMVPAGSGGAGANGGPGSKVPGSDGGFHSVSISIVSSGQGSSGHFSAGHGSVMSSSHVIIQPPAGQTSDGAGLISSEVQLQPGGSEGFGAQYENEEASEASQIESPEVPETESNGNGHKHLLNGGEPGLTAGVDQFVPGTSHIQATGGFDSFGTSPHMEITGMIDQSNHDFLVGLMGGMGESFGHETQTDGLDHMGLPFQVDSPGAALIHSQSSSDGPVVDAPPDYLSADNGNGDYTHTASSSDNGGQYRPAAETTDSALAPDTMLHLGHSYVDYSDGGADYNGGDNGADSDTNGNGNGRHKPVLDVQKGDPSAVHPDVGGAQGGAAETTDHTAGGQHAFSSIPDAVDHTFSPYADMTGHGGVTGALGQTDAAGAAGDHVTDGLLQTEITGQGHLAVTDGLPNLTATADPFTALSSQTDAMGTGGAAFTEQTQTAVPAGEQQHTSGQGFEGAENVELEDTC